MVSALRSSQGLIIKTRDSSVLRATSIGTSSMVNICLFSVDQISITNSATKRKQMQVMTKHFNSWEQGYGGVFFLLPPVRVLTDDGNVMLMSFLRYSH